jgi:hypothetical protein
MAVWSSTTTTDFALRTEVFMGVNPILAGPGPQANAKRRRLVTILFRRRVDQTLPDHEADQAGDVADAELTHQVGPVVLGGLDADM